MINLIEKAKSKALDLEVKKTFNQFLELRILNDEVKQFESSNITYYDVKAIINNKCVTISCENLNNADYVINELEKSSVILDNDDKDFLAKTNLVYEDREDLSLNCDKIKKDLLELNDYRNKYKNIFNIDSILECNYKNVEIINTSDVNLKDETGFNSIYISVSLKENEKISEASDYYLFKKYDKQEMISFFEDLLNDAIKRLNESSIKSDRYNVIINNNSMYLILKTFKDMFMAKTINKGVSLLADSFGKEIFSTLVNIIEEPESKEFFGRKLFDSEGNKCINKCLIDKGKFVNKLYDNKEALKENLVSTGNADGVSNMYLVPGNCSFKDLVQEMSDGIIITDLSGMHSGVNTITGDMSLDAKGYLVENGIITKPLKAILLSANLFEILNNVKLIGNDLRFWSTNVGSPSILCDNIMIVGEK